MLHRFVEQHDHPGAGHGIAAAERAGFGLGTKVAVDDAGDVNGFTFDPKLIHDRLRIGEAFLAAGLVGHQDRANIFRAERPGREHAGNCRVDAAGEPHHYACKARLGEFIADEPFQNACGEFAVNLHEVI